MIRRLLLALAAFLWLSPAWAVVTFDSKATADCDASASSISCTLTKSPTVGSGSDRVLVVEVMDQSSGSGPTFAVTWGGTPVPQVGVQYSTVASMGSGIFCLAAPASGNLTLAVTTSVNLANELHVMAASYTGADQTTPCKNYTSASDQSNTTATITVTSATGDIATAVFGNAEAAQGSNPNLSGTALTAYGHDFNGPFMSMEANYASGASPTVALTDTAVGAVTSWEISAVDIAAASAGPPASCPATLLLTGAGC